MTDVCFLLSLGGASVEQTQRKATFFTELDKSLVSIKLDAEDILYSQCSVYVHVADAEDKYCIHHVVFTFMWH